MIDLTIVPLDAVYDPSYTLGEGKRETMKKPIVQIRDFRRFDVDDSGFHERNRRMMIRKEQPSYAVFIPQRSARDINLGTTDDLRKAMLFVEWLTGCYRRVTFDAPVNDRMSETSSQAIRVSGVAVGFLEAIWEVVDVGCTTTSYQRCGTEEYRVGFYGNAPALGLEEPWEFPVKGSARTVSNRAKQRVRSFLHGDTADHLLVHAGFRTSPISATSGVR